MTKTKTKHSNSNAKSRVPFYRKPWVWAIFIACIAVIMVIIAMVTKPKTESPTTTNPTTPTTQKPVEAPDVDTESPAPEPEDKTQHFEGEDPNQLEELTGAIVRKTVADGNLTIVAMIDQYLTEPGICTLTMKGRQYGNTYTASSDATADITTSTCEAFVVPVNQLSSDSYQITIELSGNGKYGVITEEIDL